MNLNTVFKFGKDNLNADAFSRVIIFEPQSGEIVDQVKEVYIDPLVNSFRYQSPLSVLTHLIFVRIF